MDLSVSEIKCLMCAFVAGYTVVGRQAGAPPVLVTSSGAPPRRCPRCGGRMFLEPSAARPAELGIQVPSSRDRQEHDDSLAETQRRCVGCGAAVQRAVRCRRCYLRHRYATNPEVRAKQLALQAEWRRRQSAGAAASR